MHDTGIFQSSFSLMQRKRERTPKRNNPNVIVVFWLQLWLCIGVITYFVVVMILEATVKRDDNMYNREAK